MVMSEEGLEFNWIIYVCISDYILIDLWGVCCGSK